MDDVICEPSLCSNEIYLRVLSQSSHGSRHPVEAFVPVCEPSEVFLSLQFIELTQVLGLLEVGVSLIENLKLSV